MNALGSRTWVFSGGYMPVGSTGSEPEFTSRDELCLLNTGGVDASIEATVYFEDDGPSGPYRLTVAARRVCHVRINDLIDPHAIPLGVPYGLVVSSDRPIVAQLTRFDTRQAALASTTTLGFPHDG
ncbi:sensory rhodopsin transducer [Microbacterium sp. NPDC055910]|uniref:sensory rhodopsin transducer n=1 Tax=Microbacterium sp. NPDC055910 TaxID=3345659 RepID=UPI0035DDD8E4